MRASPDLHDYDIERWKPASREYMAYLSNKDKGAFKDAAKETSTLKSWKTRELYALIKGVLRIDPNGMMTKMSQGKPMNNLWWWDFVISDGKTLLNVMCSNSQVEIFSISNAPGFDVNEFLQVNMKLHRETVDRMIRRFEIHDTYINHYLSYKRVTEYLAKEISKLDLDKPKKYDGTLIESDDSKQLAEDMKKYLENSVKFHALGKSLVLNSAFMAEAYISLITRLGSRPVSRDDEKKLKAFGRRNFEYRLKHLYEYSGVVKVEIDTSAKEILDILEVMTLRNKYAHNDLSSEFNKLEPVYFDNDYPLFDSANNNYIVDTMEVSFHNPSIETVLNSYEASKIFIDHIQSLIDPRMLETVEEVTGLSVITQNRSTHNYSIIFRSGVSLGIVRGGKN